MMQVLNPQLAAAMTSGKMDAQTAKDMLTASVNQQDADTQQRTQQATAANDSLTNIRDAATTGQSVLNDRATQATGMLRDFNSGISANKNIGLGSSLGPNFAGNLLQGINDWTGQLAGGQQTLDAAKGAVQQIAPDAPGTAGSYATLAAMQAGVNQLVPGAPIHPALQQASSTAMTGNQQPVVNPTNPTGFATPNPMDPTANMPQPNAQPGAFDQLKGAPVGIMPLSAPGAPLPPN